MPKADATDPVNDVLQTDDWTIRYREACREHDRDRSEWSRQEQVLAQALLKLAVSFEGCDAELDHGLDQLRLALREDGDRHERAALVPRIANACAMIQRSAGESAETDLVIRLLDHLSVSERYREAATRLRVQWQATQDAISRRALTLKLAGIVRELAAVRASENGAAPDASDLLRAVLPELSLPAEFARRAAELASTLARAASVDPAREIARFLNDLHDHLRSDARAVIDYLCKATDYLSNVDQVLQRALEQGRTSMAASDELTRGINAEIDQIHEAVASDAGLADVKSLIESRVSTIRGSVAEYLGQQRGKQEEYERRIAELTQRVKTFETESVALRQSLVTEHEKAHRDALTGIPNRLAFEERARLELKRARRNRAALSLAVLDIDHFKRINDGYGHKAGDKVLRFLAEIGSRRVRATDLFARYGGEEFVLLLPDTVLDRAAEVGEALRRQVEHAQFNYKDNRVAVTVSVGVASWQTDDTLDALFERADAALYRAKAQGRNRVERSA